MKDSEATLPQQKADGHVEPARGHRRQLKDHRVLATVGVVCLILCVWLLVHWLSKPKPKAVAPAGIPVSGSGGEARSANILLAPPGTVTPVSTVTVTSRVAGELTEVHFQEGQMVKKSDLLAVIDPRPY